MPVECRPNHPNLQGNKALPRARHLDRAPIGFSRLAARVKVIGVLARLPLNLRDARAILSNAAPIAAAAMELGLRASPGWLSTRAASPRALSRCFCLLRHPPLLGGKAVLLGCWSR